MRFRGPTTNVLNLYTGFQGYISNELQQVLIVVRWLLRSIGIYSANKFTDKLIKCSTENVYQIYKVLRSPRTSLSNAIMIFFVFVFSFLQNFNAEQIFR